MSESLCKDAPCFALLNAAFTAKLPPAFSVSSEAGAIFQKVTLPTKPEVSAMLGWERENT